MRSHLLGILKTMRTVAEALANLQRTSKTPLLSKLGTLFSAAGFELALVGGPVRDAFLGRVTNDLDFTTSANPDQILEVLKGHVDAQWDVGREFGTIAAQVDGDEPSSGLGVEVDTFRSMVGNVEGLRILDLACGSGRFWPVLAEHINRVILASDNSQAMIRCITGWLLSTSIWASIKAATSSA